jgi:S1-C subfamily serine protease
MKSTQQHGTRTATNTNTRFHLYLSWGLVLAVLAFFTPLVQANEKVYQKLLPSAARVLVNHGKNNWGAGSAVLVNAEQKWVLTNYHVVQKVDYANVAFPTKVNGKLMTNPNYYYAKENYGKLNILGKVLHRDESRDLAIIELAQLPPEVKAVPLASDSPLPGQMLHIIGNPAAEPCFWQYSFGKVKQVYHKTIEVRLHTGLRMKQSCQCILATIPANPGDSGSGVVNDDGELVGLVSGCVPSVQGLSFHVDISEIHTFLAQAEKISLAKKS